MPLGDDRTNLQITYKNELDHILPLFLSETRVLSESEQLLLYESGHRGLHRLFLKIEASQKADVQASANISPNGEIKKAKNSPHPRHDWAIQKIYRF